MCFNSKKKKEFIPEDIVLRPMAMASKDGLCRVLLDPLPFNLHTDFTSHPLHEMDWMLL